MRLPLPERHITVTHVSVSVTIDRYGEETRTETSTEVEGCLHAPEHPSEADHRVVIPATLTLPGSHAVGDQDYFVYPDGDRWEAVGGGTDWGMGTPVQVRRWGRA